MFAVINNQSATKKRIVKTGEIIDSSVIKTRLLSEEKGAQSDLI
jgi:hypothetical protein